MQVERPHRAASDLLLLSGPLGRRTGWSTRRGRADRTDERGMRSVDGVQSRSRQIDALREIWRSAYVQVGETGSQVVSERPPFSVHSATCVKV